VDRRQDLSGRRRSCGLEMHEVVLKLVVAIGGTVVFVAFLLIGLALGVISVGATIEGTPGPAIGSAVAAVIFVVAAMWIRGEAVKAVQFFLADKDQARHK
jgi:hypothetical protein